MTFARAYNYIIATFLLVIYLALPATNLAHAAVVVVGVPPAQAAYSTKTTAPCDNCPCSDEHGSDCCDTTCCCACHAPLGQSLWLTYAPVIATQSFREPSWTLSQVFRPIFVPPQNPA